MRNVRFASSIPHSLLRFIYRVDTPDKHWMGLGPPSSVMGLLWCGAAALRRIKETIRTKKGKRDKLNGDV